MSPPGTDNPNQTPDPRPTSREIGHELWRGLERYAGRSSWLTSVVSAVGRGALTFRRQVSRPMRAILRDQGRVGRGPVYDVLHRRAFEFWLAHMETPGLDRAGWLESARLALFHALELFEPMDRTARELWLRFAEAYAGDIELLAELAQEVLDGDARRAEWGGPAVDSALETAAYLALAGVSAAVDAVAAARQLSEAMRMVAADGRALELTDAREFSLVRGLSCAASGQDSRARKLLEATLAFGRPDTETGADGVQAAPEPSARRAAVEVIARRGLAELLAAEQPEESLQHMLDAWELARERVPLLAGSTRHELWQRIMQREYYQESSPRSEVEQVSYHLALGRVYQALPTVRAMPVSREVERLHAWLHIELCEPLEAMAALGFAGRTGALFHAGDIDGQSIFALARAQLCDLEQALLYADQVVRARVDARSSWQLGIALARACIEHRAFDAAERLLSGLDDEAPSRNLAVSRDSVLALSLAERGDSDSLARARALFQRTEVALPENPRLTPSVRVYRALVRACLSGDMERAFSEVCDVLEKVRFASRRLRIMDGLRALDVRPGISAALGQRLYALIEPALAEYRPEDADPAGRTPTEERIWRLVRAMEPMQAVRWAAVLRAVGERDTAERVLVRVLATCDAPVGRMAWRELDRLGAFPLTAAPVTLQRYRTEPLFMGVVRLEHAERLAAMDRAHPEITELVEQCAAELPESGALPFHERVRALRLMLGGRDARRPVMSVLAAGPRAPTITVTFTSPSIWRVRTAHGHERTFLHSPALTRPADDAWVADEYWRALPYAWREIAAQLGQALYEWLDADTRALPPRGLVRVATHQAHADFVPWGLAHQGGVPLAPELVVVRSHAGAAEARAGQEPLDAREDARLVVVHADDPRAGGQTDALGGSWLSAYRAAGFAPRVLTPGQAVFGLGRVVSGPVVLHLTGALYMHRGRVFLRLETGVQASGEPLSAIDAHQLARALARARSALVILAARTPSASTERARQLVLRDFFASELMRAHPGVSVLGTGLSRSADRGAMMAAVMENLFDGRTPVYEVLRTLARRASVDHFQDSLDRGLVGPTTEDTLAAYALDIGLANTRARLMRGVPRDAMRELSTAARSPETQLASDVENLVRLANAGMPRGLALWLENALAWQAPASVPEPLVHAARTFMQQVAASLRDHAPGHGEQPLTTVGAFERVLPFAGSSLFSNQPERVFAVREEM